MVVISCIKAIYSPITIMAIQSWKITTLMLKKTVQHGLFYGRKNYLDA